MMQQRLAIFICVVAVQLTFGAAPAHAYIATDRWTRTATDGTDVGTQGSPITLTWGFAPDSTDIPGNTFGTVDSNLISFLDTNWGVGPGGSDLTQRPWFFIFQQSFARISAISGVTYGYEPSDDGNDFSGSNTPSARGVLGTRGDIRLGGKSYGAGSNVLASNYFPNYGEMMINSDQGSFFTFSNNNYRRFRNTIMHEAMHGLGISHVESGDAGFLIEPILSASFDGPQLDDVLAIQRLYGDAYEKSGGNDTFSVATSLGSLSSAQSIPIGTLGDSTTIGSSQVDFLSIDDDSDTDFFSFSLSSRLDVQLQLTPHGTSYLVGPQGGTQATLNTLSLSNLSLALFDTNGASVLSLADNNPAGAGEVLLQQLLPGTYYARVKGANDNIQLYGLNLSASVPLPRDLVWVGSSSTNWNVGATANFSDGDSSTVFYDLDHVTFDDTSSVKSVNLPGNVSAGDVRITTAASYVFSGAGGIVGGNLTIDGAGTVTLANSGNSYSGTTHLLAGTLQITGNANAMVSAISIADGATLLMEATDAADMTSTITINSGGSLQIGSVSSDGNIFPDAPSLVVNNGTIRILDDELLRSVSGSGQIIAEGETTSLMANAAFNGQIVVKSGAIGRVEDVDGLGSAIGATVVEAGGSLVIDASGTFADPISLAGDGLGNGAIQIAAGRSASLTGNVMLDGNSAVIRVEQNSIGTLAGAVNGAANDTRLILDVSEGGSLSIQNAIALSSGGVTKQGPGTSELGGNLSYSGATFIDEGLLRLTGSGTLAGDLQIASSAILELAGTHEFAPSTRLSGNGLVVGDLAMPGTIAPGNSAGMLALTDNLTLAETSRFEIELGGTELGIDYDALHIAGSASLSGILDVALTGTFDPVVDNAFEVLRAESGIFGQFHELTLPALAAGLAWNVLYGSDSMLLQVVVANVTSLPDDYNGDGFVDAADYVVWRKTDGTSQGYDSWRAHFGEPAGSGSGARETTNVPEPATIVMLIVAIVGTRLRRRYIPSECRKLNSA